MADSAAALRAAATVAFEELGLLCVGPAVARRAEPAVLAAAVRVDFTGARAGRLTLRVSPGVFRALPENMLGLDGPDAEPWRWDALGEMANVICGNVLPRLLAPGDRLVLSPPQRGAPPTYASSATLVELDVEMGQVGLVLEMG